MPKRNNRVPKESDRERRPPELTLASFLSGSLASQTSVVSEGASSADQLDFVGTRATSKEEEKNKRNYWICRQTHKEREDSNFVRKSRQREEGHSCK